MEAKYLQAIKAGLICGIAIAVIYLALNIVDLYLNSTPAMVSYYDQALKPFQDIMKDWPNVTGQYSYPQDMPGPPGEYYISTGLRVLSLGVLIIGLLITGACGIGAVRQPKYTPKEAASLGGVSGLAALVPLVVAQLIMIVIMAIVQGPFHTMIGFMPGSAAAMLPFMAVAGCCCCCLPVAIVAAIIVAAIGALVYALFTNRIGQATAAV